MLKRATDKGKADWCMAKNEGVELNYVCGATTTFSFDLCLVVNCGNGGAGWEGYAIYLCMDERWSEYCKQRRYSLPRPIPCGSWSGVTSWTGSGWTPDKKALPGNLTNISIQRGTLGRAITNGRNPFMLSMHI
ncbi:hypothetical protein GOODEAATRI_032907 [Goodea atripinnis]|uniref:Uncharacterized protein n=1 Tax=Goodea atripinnis TaxID=208336 RepID=A0ABV0NZP5_9TELE